MFYRQDVSIDRLHSLLSYDPETGILTWRKRPEHNAMDKRLNSRYAGKIAGYIAHTGYHSVGIDGVDMLAHRVIYAMMTGDWPPDQIDHINGVKNDNRWANIRPATHGQNMCNRGTTRNNSSGQRGVSWRRDLQKWRVFLRQDGQWISGGNFLDFEDAKKAYWELAYELRGEYAGF